MKLAIIADNLAGGGARLAEKILRDFMNFPKEFDEVNLLHSGNLLVPVHPKISASFCDRENSFINAHKARSEWVNEKIKPDVVLNLTNFPIFCGKNTSVKQLCLLHQAFIVARPEYTISPGSLKDKLKEIARSSFFSWCLKRTHQDTHILVQTDWMREQFCRKFADMHSKVSVVPQVFEIAQGGEVTSYPELLPKFQRFWYYPAAFEQHKNHYSLLPILEEMRSINSQAAIVVTLSERDLKVKHFLDKAKPFLDSGLLHNVGWISSDQSHFLLKEAQGLLFLSTLESLGLPVVEALALGKSILAAEFAATRELAKNTAEYFDLRDSKAIKELASKISSSEKVVSKDVTKSTLNYFDAYVGLHVHNATMMKSAH